MTAARRLAAAAAGLTVAFVAAFLVGGAVGPLSGPGGDPVQESGTSVPAAPDGATTAGHGH